MNEVAVDGTLQLMAGGGEAEHADGAWVERMVVGEGGGVDEDEVLVAGVGGVGIDPVDVDPVAIGVAEVLDDVVFGRRRAEADGVEDERIGPAPGEERLLCRAGDEQVAAAAAVDGAGDDAAALAVVDRVARKE